MPTPETSLATLRPDLAGSFEEFNLAMDRMGFIATRVLPVIETARASGTYGIIPIEQLLQEPEVTRTSKTGYRRGDWTFQEGTFATKEYGWEEPVDDRNAALYAEFLDSEMFAAERARDFVLRAHEKRAADLLFNATTWTGASLTTGVTNEWDDTGNAAPIDDVEAAVRKVWEGTGLWPNVLIVNRLVFRNLRLCAQVRDRISSSGAGAPTKASDITPAMLAAVFDLEEVIVAGSPRNTADEGIALSISPIWDNEYAMVARVARSGNINEPCVGRTFHWGADGSTIGGTYESYRDETTRSDIIRVRHEVQEKVLYTAAAHLLSNITT